MWYGSNLDLTARTDWHKSKTSKSELPALPNVFLNLQKIKVPAKKVYRVINSVLKWRLPVGSISIWTVTQLFALCLCTSSQCIWIRVMKLFLLNCIKLKLKIYTIIRPWSIHFIVAVHRRKIRKTVSQSKYLWTRICTHTYMRTPGCVYRHTQMHTRVQVHAPGLFLLKRVWVGDEEPHPEY